MQKQERIRKLGSILRKKSRPRSTGLSSKAEAGGWEMKALLSYNVNSRPVCNLVSPCPKTKRKQRTGV